MGITADSMKRLTPYLRPGINMLELGAQNTYYNPHYGRIAKDVFEEMLISHISIDIIEHQKCVQADLREKIPFEANNHMVTNFGTLEHVDGSLYTPFLNIHNACKEGGVMIHENPMTGNWPGHGYHYFTQKFYIELAKACKYELLEVSTEAAMGNTVDGWNICAVLRKVVDNDFIPEEDFNKIYVKHIKSK
jgi:hypothetical protein